MKNIWVEVAMLAIVVALILGGYLKLASSTKDTNTKAFNSVKTMGDNIK